MFLTWKCWPAITTTAAKALPHIHHSKIVFPLAQCLLADCVANLYIVLLTITIMEKVRLQLKISVLIYNKCLSCKRDGILVVYSK